MSNESVKPPAAVSWFARFSKTFLREPQDRKQILEFLQDAKARKLIDADDLAMMEGVFYFADMQARDIMIPRSQMVLIYEEETPQEFMPRIMESGHSRFPVFDDNETMVIGILHAKDLLQYTFAKENGKKFHLRDVIRPAIVIPESKRLNILLREFRINRNHMAAIVDEYGSIAGFVTIEDILELIVGDIEDEFDIEQTADIKKHSPTEYIIKAQASISEFNEYFKSHLDEKDFDTIGGLIVNQLGHVPEVGEQTIIENFQFKVLHADSRRIHLLEMEIKPYEMSHRESM